MKYIVAISFIIASIAVVPVARAESPAEAFAFELRGYTSSFTRAWIVSKYVTFSVGKACASKLPDRKHDAALEAASHFALSAANFAKQVTGDDWLGIERQSNDLEGNRKLVEAKMDAFKGLSLNLKVEGDDCSTKKGSALWLKYWAHVGAALKKFPPKAKKAFITIDARAEQKTVEATVSEDGATFNFILPRDVEAKGWSQEIEKTFHKVSSVQK